MKYNYIYLGILAVLLLIMVHFKISNTEPFYTNDTTDEATVTIELEHLANSLKKTTTKGPNENNTKELFGADVNAIVENMCFTNICPVNKGYNPNDYIRKTEALSNANCPPTPNLNDFILKSACQPNTKCPPCICPKVQVNATCNKNDNNGKYTNKCGPCPRPSRCDLNDCPKCEYYGVITVSNIHEVLDQLTEDMTNLDNLNKLIGIKNKILEIEDTAKTTVENVKIQLDQLRPP